MLDFWIFGIFVLMSPQFSDKNIRAPYIFPFGQKSEPKFAGITILKPLKITKQRLSKCFVDHARERVGGSSTRGNPNVVCR